MKAYALIATLAILSGCGGSSDGDDSGPSTADFQVSAGFTKLATSRSPIYAASSKINGVEVHLRVEILPQSQTFSFEGQQREYFHVQQAVTAGGISTPTQVTTLAFSRGPFTLHGVIDEPEVVTPRETPVPAPVMAKTGASGRLLAGRQYMRENPNSSSGTTVIDWTLEPNNSKTSHLCLQFNFIEEGAFDKYCFTMTPNGDPTGDFQAVTSSGGVSYLFQ